MKVPRLALRRAAAGVVFAGMLFATASPAAAATFSARSHGHGGGHSTTHPGRHHAPPATRHHEATQQHVQKHVQAHAKQHVQAHAKQHVQAHAKQHVQAHVQKHVRTHVQKHVRTHVQKHVRTHAQQHVTEQRHGHHAGLQKRSHHATRTIRHLVTKTLAAKTLAAKTLAARTLAARTLAAIVQPVRGISGTSLSASTRPTSQHPAARRTLLTPATNPTHSTSNNHDTLVRSIAQTGTTRSAPSQNLQIAEVVTSSRRHGVPAASATRAPSTPSKTATPSTTSTPTSGPSSASKSPEPIAGALNLRDGVQLHSTGLVAVLLGIALATVAAMAYVVGIGRRGRRSSI